MIRSLQKEDDGKIFSVINDAAKKYKDKIPDDCYSIPYMSLQKIRKEIQDGVEFYGFEISNELVGVMGHQAVKDVYLIRHAYVLTDWQGQGIGKLLLAHILSLVDATYLVGTWDRAIWAIQFYQKNGFKLSDSFEGERLLDNYWNITDVQRDNSVVLRFESIRP